MRLLVSPLTIRWKILFDAFLLSSGPSNNGFGNSAAFLNGYVVDYTPEMIVNRVLLILGCVLCLVTAYLKFTPHERAQSKKRFSVIAILIQLVRGHTPIDVSAYMMVYGVVLWLYHPMLYQLWNYADLTGNNQAFILVHRIYCLGIAGFAVAFAHLFFPRKCRTKTRLK